LHSRPQTCILSAPVNTRITAALNPAGIGTPCMQPMTFDAAQEHDTHRLGLALGQAAQPGLVVGLNGDLGAGKTRLVRAVVEGLDGSPRDVSSPTFVLLQHYAARLTVHHADAYRLHSVTEFLDLGSEEWTTDSGIALIEWADRVADSLPIDRLDVQITVTGESSRRFRLTAGGTLSEQVLGQLDCL